MKIRSAEELLNYLDGEMAWRLKEVHELSSAVQSAKDRNINAHIRAGVAMLYAHWEGFIKAASNAYINYLSHRADRNCDLQPCFIALGLKKQLSQVEDSSKASIAISTVSQLIAQMEKPAALPRSEAVSTKSNLNSEVFENIANWIGLDSSRYSTRFNLIDETLLATRNSIAHGEYLVIDKERFDSLVHAILEMLRWFKTDIENATVSKTFLRNIN